MGELFDQDAVFGEETGVVDADAVFEPGADTGAVGAGEVEAVDRLCDGLFFFAGSDIDAGEGLGTFRGIGLSEMDDIDRGFAVGGKLFEGLCEWGFAVSVVEGDGAILRLDGGRGPSVEGGQFVHEERSVTERGGHEEEAGMGQGKEGDLPGDAAIAVGIVVELVEDGVLERALVTFAEGAVGEDLGGATEDGGVAIDRGIAGAEADVIGAKLTTESEPFFVDEGLDGAGVDGATTLGEGFEVERGGDE